MEIKKTVTPTCTTLFLSGCLDTASVAGFSASLDEVASAKSLVIDFTDLEFIASSGLRTLVLVQKQAKAEGRELVLSGMNDVVSEVFEVTGLKEVFEIR